MLLSSNFAPTLWRPDWRGSNTNTQPNFMIADVYQGVFDTSYDITFRDRLPRFGGHHTNGYIDPVNDRIVIRRDLPIGQRALTLLHEIVHECYPEWSEADVEACASYTYERLSDQDQAIVNFLATDPEETRLPARTTVQSDGR